MLIIERVRLICCQKHDLIPPLLLKRTRQNEHIKKLFGKKQAPPQIDEPLRPLNLDRLDKLGYGSKESAPATRSFSHEDIQCMKDKGDIEGLIEALQYPKDPWVRTRATEALIQIGAPQAIEPLISAALQETNQACYESMTRQLAHSDDSRIVDACVVLASIPNKSHSALLAIQEIQQRKLLDDRIIDALDLLLFSESTRKRTQEDCMRLVAIVLEIKKAQQTIKSLPPARPLPLALKEGTLKECIEAIKTLQKTGDDAAGDILITALHTTKTEVRYKAISALIEMEYEPAFQPVVRSLIEATVQGYYSDNSVIEILNQLGTKKGGSEAIEKEIPTLVSLLGKGFDPDRRRRVANILRALGWQPFGRIEQAKLAIADGNWEDVMWIGRDATDVVLTELQQLLEKIDQDGYLSHEGIDQAQPVIRVLVEIGTSRAFAPTMAVLKKYNGIASDTLAEETIITIRGALMNILSKDRRGIPEESLYEACLQADICVPKCEVVDYGEDEDEYGRYTRSYSHNYEELIDFSDIRRAAGNELERRQNHL